VPFGPALLAQAWSRTSLRRQRPPPLSPLGVRRLRLPLWQDRPRLGPSRFGSRPSRHFGTSWTTSSLRLLPPRWGLRRAGAALGSGRRQRLSAAFLRALAGCPVGQWTGRHRAGPGPAFRRRGAAQAEPGRFRDGPDQGTVRDGGSTEGQQPARRRTVVAVTLPNTVPGPTWRGSSRTSERTAASRSSAANNTPVVVIGAVSLRCVGALVQPSSRAVRRWRLGRPACVRGATGRTR